MSQRTAVRGTAGLTGKQEGNGLATVYCDSAEVSGQARRAMSLLRVVNTLALCRVGTLLKGAHALLLTILASTLLITIPVSAQSIGNSETRRASVRGTVLDPTGDIVPDATVVLQGPVASDRRTVVTKDDGAFLFDDLTAGTPYKVTVTAEGLEEWSSPLTLEPGESKSLTGVKLRVAAVQRTLTVSSSQSKEIAAQQLKAEEKQRVLGIIPNIYVSYERHPEPLTAKMKFELAVKDLTHPIFLARVALLAGLGQATDNPDYGQGAEGYGKRVGVAAADSVSESMIGNALLPALLHQDPRYFYGGDGTTKSRFLHAISAPFVCPGDNGSLQPNYSTWAAL